MAHKSLIGGTSYNISGGKSLISGTSYNISKGRTLIDGTGYDIQFISIPPTYAMLYSDGDMVFQTGNIADSTKTLINEYDTKFINDGYSGYQSISWYMNMNNIINVSFKNEISFKTMRYWFYNARNLKYVN